MIRIGTGSIALRTIARWIAGAANAVRGALPSMLKCGMALGIAAAAVVSPVAEADDTAFCTAWARKTTQQYFENRGIQCLPKDDIGSELTINFSRCMSLGRDLADQFTKLVEDRLAECRAQIVKEKGALIPGPKIGDILKETTPPPPPAQPPAGGNTATVIADVDVYKAAGGGGKSVGVLRSNNKTTKVSLVAPCEDNWCHVKGNPVPTGEGWVYSGTFPDFQSLQF